MFQSNYNCDFMFPPWSSLDFLFYTFEAMLLDVQNFIFYIFLVISNFYHPDASSKTIAMPFN